MELVLRSKKHYYSFKCVQVTAFKTLTGTDIFLLDL